MADLLKEERHRLILESIRDIGRVTVEELSRRFGTSEVTIRRDLSELSASGKIRRTHRGALLLENPPAEPPVVQRMIEQESAKNRIGKAASALVEEGQSIFIGSGSTTIYVARHLSGCKNLTVVTNALNIASELAANEVVTVVVTGGLLRASELSLIGHIAELSLQEVRVDKVIVGIPAISPEAGLSNDYLPEVMTDRAIIKMAPELIVVADHTKFGRVASAYLAPVERVTTLVTDAEADPKILAALREKGIRLIVAEG
jgi:DeoR/GlpR family transcriptional regulator of sugar metabolism